MNESSGAVAELTEENTNLKRRYEAWKGQRSWTLCPTTLTPTHPDLP